MKRLLALARCLATILVLLGLAAQRALALVRPPRPATGPEARAAPRHALLRAPRAAAGELRVVPWGRVPRLVETAARGLARDRALFERMHELAQEASNGALNTCVRTALSTSFAAHLEHVEEVARTTGLDDLPLLNGAFDVLLEGPPPGALVFLDLPDARAIAYAGGLEHLDLTTVTNASAAVLALDVALTQVAEHRATLSAAWQQL